MATPKLDLEMVAGTHGLGDVGDRGLGAEARSLWSPFSLVWPSEDCSPFLGSGSNFLLPVNSAVYVIGSIDVHGRLAPATVAVDAGFKHTVSVRSRVGLSCLRTLQASAWIPFVGIADHKYCLFRCTLIGTGSRRSAGMHGNFTAEVKCDGGRHTPITVCVAPLTNRKTAGTKCPSRYSM